MNKTTIPLTSDNLYDLGGGKVYSRDELRQHAMEYEHNIEIRHILEDFPKKEDTE